MQGSLSEGVLPGILRDLYVGRRTGLLYFIRSEERRGVRFRKGHVVRADTNVKEERLGDTLVRLGQLSQADLDRANEVVVRDKKRLGVALQELGILDKDRLEEAIALHVHEILLKVFSWREGTYAFEDQDPEAPVDEDVTLRVPTGEIILEAARRVEDPDVVRYALGDLDRILGLSADPLLRFQRITLSPIDGYVLSRVDGTLSAHEVIQLIPMVPEETQRSLFGLLCTGTIEYLPLPPKKPVAQAKPLARRAAPPPPAPPSAPPEPPSPPPKQAAPPPAPAPAPKEVQAPVTPRRQEIIEAYESIKTRNHFEVLEIPKASSEQQVKEAYFRLARRYHPDTHHDPALADLKDKIEAVFIRLGVAYEVLRNPRTRGAYEADLASRAPRAAAARAETPPPDPEAEARLAEASFKRAEKMFKEEKYWDAIQLLEPAITRVPVKLKTRARVLLANCYLKNPKWVKRAEEMLEDAAKEDPKSVDAYFVLGTIYKGGGLRRRAAAMFRKVLDLRPEHEQAAAELAELAPLPEEEAAAAEEKESGGLLKKLFGKG